MDRKRKPLTQLPTNDQKISGSKRMRSNSKSNCSSFCDENDKYPGTIKKMVLKNFMCHSLLEVNFKSNICFITGCNGSGKSAILTALIVGFGGKANLTNRGSSIKNFIKVGKKSASVEITLANSGPLAYRKNIYGNSIIIIRNFSLSGSSNYRVKSETGELITTQLKEIEKIKQHLNIQIDNPVCILNQDTSRNFLSTLDAKQRFILFMRATRLDSLRETISTIKSNKNNSLRLWKEKDSEFKKLIETKKELEDKLESHRSIVQLKENVKQLQSELLWSTVRDSENDYEQQEAVVNEHLEKYSELKRLKDSRFQETDRIKEEVNSLQQQILEIRAVADSQNKQNKSIEQNLNQLRETFKEKRKQKHLLQQTLEAKKADSVSLEKEIANASNNIKKIEEEKTERAQTLAKVLEKVKNIDDILLTTRNDLFQCKSDNHRKNEDIKNLRAEIEKLNEDIDRHRNNLSALEKESSNKLLLYGRDAPRIIQGINALQKVFSQLPRGPIGSYLSLTDKKWAVAAEGFLGSRFLHSFLVDNNKDNALLMRILDRVCSNFRPSVFTTKFFNKIHDVSKNLVDQPHDCISLYNALKMSDPVVANCVIDQRSPETVLLIPSDKRAIELLSNRHVVPANCKQGVTVKGDTYYPDPNFKTYCSTYHRAQYLQMNAAEQISYLKTQINVLENSRESIMNQMRTLQTEMNEQQTKQAELEDKIKKLMIVKETLKRKYDQIKLLPEPEVLDADILQREIEDLKRDINNLTISYENADKEITDLKEKIQDSERKMDEAKQKSKSFEERIRPLEEQIAKLKKRRDDLSMENESAKNALEKHLTELNAAKAELQKIQEAINTKILQASKVGERMDNIRQVPEIAQQIKEVEKKIRLVESDNEDPKDLAAKYQLYTEKHQELSQVLDILCEDIAQLETTAEQRKRHYSLTENFFISFARHSFEQILEQRQFSGSIEFDINNKELNLIVMPQQGSQGVVTKVTNLSGGERSFSTVSFLYSLWQCMNLPFYFLDEFDVYMDKLNRTKVVEMLLDFAKTRPEFQYVFLTPQDISFIHDESVDIHRLEDPKRVNAEA